MQHILIVEDEEHLAVPIQYNLEAEGYSVTVVGDGPAALKTFGEQTDAIDLIILDLMLPGMSGYAVCEQIRASGSVVPVLMLSARTLVEDRIRGFDVGTDVYLQKPFELEELMSVVRNLLDRKKRLAAVTAVAPATPEEPDDGSIISFGRATVNFETYEVSVAGEPLKLTTLEIKLLKYFIEHEGVVVTRDELLKNVWGMHHIPTTRTVDNFIVNLRKYFEVDPAQPRHFLSVRGASYRFVSDQK